MLSSVILIGIALSMDTFSLSLGIGIFKRDRKIAFKLAMVVGCMHFIMPFLGMLLGNSLIKLLEINIDILLGFILIIIAIQMLIDLVKKEENKFNLSNIGIFLFALGVSLDSFSVGLGIKAITDNIYLAMGIFALCSFTFTYIGIVIGEYANKIMGTYANIIGIIILFVLGLVHII
ncbi:MAG: manganese efflux pump MntP family protein [Ruminococcus sp.]|nr:manganese efflux pump MntP family protein [Ruminococcus sp.]